MDEFLLKNERKKKHGEPIKQNVLSVDLVMCLWILNSRTPSWREDPSRVTNVYLAEKSTGKKFLETSYTRILINSGKKIWTTLFF